MNLRTFVEPAEFRRRVESALMENEAANALIFGVVLRLCAGYSYGTEPPLLACVEDRGEISAIAVQTPPHNLLLRGEGDSEAIAWIARELADADVRLPGVHAERATALRFAEAWAKAAGCSHEIAMEQRLYRLTKATPPVGVPGRLRLARPEDRELLIRWVDAFFEEAVAGSPDAESEKMVDRLTEAGSLVVWDDDDPVSIANCGRPTPSGISITLVYTSPSKRGRGYASACVAALSQRQLDAGRRYCTLFTDLANRTANEIYRRVGYRSIGDFVEIRFLRRTSAGRGRGEGG